MTRETPTSERQAFNRWLETDYSPDRSGATSEADEKAFIAVLFHVWQARANLGNLPDARTDELIASVKEVIRISDREHEAWDRAKAAIESFGISEQVFPAPTVPDERKAFESFIDKRFGDTIDQRRAKNGDQGYMEWDMVVAWIVWQGRAAMLNDGVLTNEGANQAGNSPIIPDGWVIVPKEPTREMVQTVADEVHPPVFVRAVYKTMLAAAPNRRSDENHCHHTGN